MSNAVEQSLRPLGAFERIIDFYMDGNPMQFSLVVQFGRNVSEPELTAALRELQQAHPLLRVQVDRQVFRRSSTAIPIRLAPGSTWQSETATEQTDPIPRAPGPLLRTVLIPAGGEQAGATVIVTFAHQIADGRGALRVVEDLITALAGSPVTPGRMPEAQEVLLGLTPAPAPSTEPVRSPPADAVGVQPFSGSAPVTQTAELDAERSLLLRQRVRKESCTLPAALCAAAASALGKVTGRDQIRINVPIDLRQAAGLPDEVAVRFFATTIMLEPRLGLDFWDLVRQAVTQLAAVRDPHVVRASALGLAQLRVTGADDAKAAMLAGTTIDIEIANLGVSQLPETAGVEALWGPTMTTQVTGEHLLGVITHSGVLRMVNTTHASQVDLCVLISGILEQACR